MATKPKSKKARKRSKVWPVPGKLRPIHVAKDNLATNWFRIRQKKLPRLNKSQIIEDFTKRYKVPVSLSRVNEFARGARIPQSRIANPMRVDVFYAILKEAGFNITPAGAERLLRKLT